jgi:hypothetical protein
MDMVHIDIGSYLVTLPGPCPPGVITRVVLRIEPNGLIHRKVRNLDVNSLLWEIMAGQCRLTLSNPC